MKRKAGAISLILFFLLFLTDVARSFSFFSRRSWIRPRPWVATFSVGILENAAKTFTSYRLNGVVLTPINSFKFYSPEGEKIVLTLRFNSPSKIIGYSLYIYYSSEEFEAAFAHQNHWYSLWAHQPPAAYNVMSEYGGPSRFSGFNNFKLLGVMLQEPQNDLGDIIIETGLNNTFRFIFYTYI